MARSPEGWKLKWVNGIAHVRFTHERHRYDISTKAREAGPAKKAAAQIYADVISGRMKRAASGALVKPTTELAVLGEEWLEDIAPELAEDGDRVYETYIRHWCDVMPTIGSVTPARIGDYQRSRLKSVTRGSVDKELTAFRRFLRWCVEKEIIRALPDFPAMGKKSLGTPAQGVRKAPTSVLIPEEVESVLAWSKQDPFFVACWETGLRPISTLSRLRREDLTPFGLVIRPECDKNGWGRTVPLSKRAREALEAGLPFGKRARLKRFKRACEKALGRRDVTIYDLKHARATLWVDSGMPLGGVSFLLGVSIETLVNRYAHSSRRAAEQVLRGNSGAKGKTMAKAAMQKQGDVSVGTYNPKASRPKVKGLESGKSAKQRNTSPHSGAAHQNDAALPAVVRVALFQRSREVA
jgi:integrase